MSTIINRSACWYHITTGGETVSWQRGGPRKGGSGIRQLGLVRFNVSAITAAMANGLTPAAALRLTRDTAYGTDAVDVTVAPVKLPQGSMDSDDMSYADAMQLAVRDLHKTMAVMGEVCDFPLPGAWIDLMTRERYNAFMLYREDGEGTDAELRCTDDVRLVLEDAGTVRPPVWRRPIAKGDIISDRLNSHIGDLRELEHYINVRREAQQLAPVDIDIHDVGLYADWPAVIQTLRDATDDVIAAEGGEAVTWCEIDPDELPKAQAINELRQALASFGPEEQLSVTDFGYTSFEHLNTDFKVNRGELTRWVSGQEPKGGMCWQYEMRLLKPTDTEKTKVKVYMRRFGIWLLSDLIQGKTVNRLRLRVTRLRGEQTTREIQLYAVTRAAIPTERATVNQVIDGSLIMGAGGAPVGGEVTFELTPEGVTALKSGDVYGVAVDDKGAWTNYSMGATLIINGEDE